MYHSITFTDFSNPNDKANTWDDWHLIPYPRPHVAPPQQNRKTVDIPGKNGHVDISNILTGYATYKNRTGQWDFYVENDYWSWEVAYSSIMGFLNGNTFRIVLEDDPGYYYYGQCWVNAWQSDRTHSRITLEYDLYPYKNDIETSLDDWIWDPFNFETDTITEPLTDIVLPISQSANRNRLVVTAQSGVVNGVQYTVNSDKSVTVNRVEASSTDSVFELGTIDASVLDGKKFVMWLPNADTTSLSVELWFAYPDGHELSPRTIYRNPPTSESVAFDSAGLAQIKIGVKVWNDISPNGEVFYPYVTLEDEWDPEYTPGLPGIVIDNDYDEPGTPTFIVSDLSQAITVKHQIGSKNSSLHTILENGDYKFRDIVMHRGKNHFYFTGTGKVSILYRGGKL